MIVISIQVSIMNNGSKTGIGTVIGPLYFKSGTPAEIIQKKIDETTKGYGERAQTVLPNTEIRFELVVGQEIPDVIFIGFFQQTEHGSLDEYLEAAQAASRAAQSPAASAQMAELVAAIQAKAAEAAEAAGVVIDGDAVAGESASPFVPVSDDVTQSPTEEAEPTIQ
jgi:hypothetical protein